MNELTDNSNVLSPTLRAAVMVAVGKVLMQGFKCADSRGCVYRHTDGVSKCIIGHLIADGFYEKYFEGTSIKGLVSENDSDKIFNAVIKSMGLPISDKERDLLYLIQKSHDSIPKNGDFKRTLLSNLSKIRGLFTDKEILYWESL